MAQAEIAAKDARIADLESAVAQRDFTINRLYRERDEARALLAHLRTSLNERHNDPMQDGGKHGG